MTDILIIEDDTTLREALQINLKASGYNTISAADGKEGLRLARKDRPKVIILDILLPKIDGFSLCEHLRSNNSEIIIIMLTALGSESEKLKGFSLGADDYITKPFNVSELTARIKAHLKRAKPSQPIHNEVIRLGDIVIDRSSHEITVKNKKVVLRPKEYYLLLKMAQEPSKLFTREQLAQKVWGYNHLSSSRTVDVHIQKLRGKVEKYSDYKFFITIHGLGYKLELQKKQIKH